MKIKYIVKKLGKSYGCKYYDEGPCIATGALLKGFVADKADGAKQFDSYEDAMKAIEHVSEEGTGFLGFIASIKEVIVLD